IHSHRETEIDAAADSQLDWSLEVVRKTDTYFHFIFDRGSKWWFCGGSCEQVLEAMGGRKMEWTAQPNHLGGAPRRMAVAAAAAFAKVVVNLLNTTTVHNGDTLLRLVKSRPPGVPLITVSNHMLDDPLMWGFKGFPTSDAKVARWVLAAEDICFKNTVLSYFFRVDSSIKPPQPNPLSPTNFLPLPRASNGPRGIRGTKLGPDTKQGPRGIQADLISVLLVSKNSLWIQLPSTRAKVFTLRNRDRKKQHCGHPFCVEGIQSVNPSNDGSNVREFEGFKPRPRGIRGTKQGPRGIQANFFSIILVPKNSLMDPLPSTRGRHGRRGKGSGRSGTVGTKLGSGAKLGLEVFRNWGRGWGCALVWDPTKTAGKCIPITRGGGIYQEHMNEALDRLSEGEWLHTFPEGKVSQEDLPIRRLKWGTASLIARAPVTPIVLPIVHHGFEKDPGGAAEVQGGLQSECPTRRRGEDPKTFQTDLSQEVGPGGAVMPENYMFGRRPPFPLCNRNIQIIIGEPVKFDVPKLKELALSTSRKSSLPSDQWPSTSPDGLDVAAQRYLYTTISEKIRSVMESLRSLGRIHLKSKA
ncbi:hypothetical protein RJ640_026545, partial [Escallonia rubra]